MIAILNASVLTAYGSFSYHPISLDAAREKVQDGFLSAVGHESTAQILSSLLGVKVDVNRIVYVQPIGAEVIVFKLKGRAPEGRILTVDEILAIGYEFGLLTRS